MSNKLTDRERELYEKFANRYDEDVPIDALHDALYGGDTDARTPQQRLGALISRINKKLPGERIEPGKLKRTYRLTRTK